MMRMETTFHKVFMRIHNEQTLLKTVWHVHHFISVRHKQFDAVHAFYQNIPTMLSLH